MSDSDSDDNFSSLITNGEENFWKTYKNEKPNIDCIGPSTSGTANSKLSTKKKIPKRSLSPKPLCDSDNSLSPPRTKKRKTKSAAIPSSSQSTNTLLNTILNTLAQAKIPEPPTQLTNISNDILGLGTSLLPTIETSQPIRRSTRNQKSHGQQHNLNTLLPSEQLTPTLPKTAKKNPPRKKKKNNADTTVINEIDLGTSSNIAIEDGSRTPPYKQPSFDIINHIVDVKVIWKAIYLKIFKIKRFSPLKEVVDYFAKTENVDSKNICFSINDKIVNLNVHSCVTLNYKFYYVIEGSVGHDFDTNIFSRVQKGIKLRTRLNKTIENIVLNPDIMLEHLYAQVVLRFNLSLSKFLLQFDGQVINYFETIETLKLEEDDCIDIMLV